MSSINILTSKHDSRLGMARGPGLFTFSVCREKLTIIDTDSLVASGITIQPPSQPVKASASGF
jgi:hypothetical protein